MRVYIENIFWNFRKLLYICSPNRDFLSDIEIWCNGSTTDSGSVSEGSNPSISTKCSDTATDLRFPVYGGLAQLVRAHDS